MSRNLHICHAFAFLVVVTHCSETAAPAELKDAVLAESTCSSNSDLACKQNAVNLLQHTSKAHKASRGEVVDCFPYPQNFNLTNVTVNNLAGVGPIFNSVPVLRYSSAAKTQSGVIVDFVLRALTSYTAADASQNGVQGILGTINVAAGSSVTLAIDFMRTGTKDIVQMEEFDLSFFDINTLDAGLSETITIGGFKEYHLSPTTELVFSKLPSGLHQFAAGKKGSKTDISKYPNLLSASEADRAVHVKFRNVSQISFTLSVGSGTGGRTFEFGGKSSLVQCAAVPAGWGRPSCGVVPEKAPLSEVGYRTVLQGHPLCLQADMTSFVRRVIKGNGMCIKDEMLFGKFANYFNGVCTLKGATLGFNDLVSRLKQDIRRPTSCGGGWIVPAGTDGSCRNAKPSLLQLPEQISQGTGQIGKSAPLSEYGYRMVALTNSRTDMKTFIRRMATRLDLRVVTESGLDGFAPHYLSRCGMRSFDALVYELQLKGFALPCNCGADWIRWNPPPI